ncbi:MAG: hypothetical protein ACXVY5_02255 [Gaiellales bacterium]
MIGPVFGAALAAQAGDTAAYATLAAACLAASALVGYAGRARRAVRV